MGTDAQGHRSEPLGAPGAVCKVDKGRTRELLNGEVLEGTGLGFYTGETTNGRGCVGGARAPGTGNLCSGSSVAPPPSLLARGLRHVLPTLLSGDAL